MDDLAVDISLFIDGAFHRVAGLSSDLRVAMNVARTDNDVLQLVVEGITVENTEQIYNEIAEGAKTYLVSSSSWSTSRFKPLSVTSFNSNWISRMLSARRWVPP